MSTSFVKRKITFVICCQNVVNWVSNRHLVLNVIQNFARGLQEAQGIVAPAFGKLLM